MAPIERVGATAASLPALDVLEGRIDDASVRLDAALAAGPEGASRYAVGPHAELLLAWGEPETALETVNEHVATLPVEGPTSVQALDLEDALDLSNTPSPNSVQRTNGGCGMDQVTGHTPANEPARHTLPHNNR